MFLQILLLIMMGNTDGDAKPQYRSVTEIMKITEASEVSYELKPVDTLKDRPDNLLEILFPPMGDVEPFMPWVENGELSKYPISEGDLQGLMEAETHFREKDYEKAALVYKEVLGKWPKCMLAMVNLGDCYLFDGKPRKALKHYKQAIEINPYDYRNHFYAANALIAMDKNDKALDHYVKALTLCPRRETVLTVLEKHAKRLGIMIYRDPFNPPVAARREGEAVAVYLDVKTPASAAWIAYAINKAAWIGEEETDIWSTHQEFECLANLLSAYNVVKAEDPAIRDHQLEWLLEVSADSGMLRGFIFYELASRFNPMAMLLMPQEVHDNVEAYIRKYVLVMSR